MFKVTTQMELIPPPPPPLPASFLVKDRDESAKSQPGIDADNLLILDALKLWMGLHHAEDQKRIFLTSWMNTSTILQQGPQCGLVALAMASKACGLQYDSHTIYKKAVDMGITKRGEMFSSTALCELATHLKIDTILLNDGFTDAHVLLRHLFSGKMLLVPYDADCNHSPCLKNGHKAHWALIVGVLFEVDYDRLTSKCSYSWELIGENLYRIRGVEAYCEVSTQLNCNEIYFLAKQGKSKRLAIWSYQSLKESNNNLSEVDPMRTNNVEYVLPHNNKLTDLCGKIIVVG